MPKAARVLDVGCGDGAVAAALMARRQDVSVAGIDVLPRKNSLIQVGLFDGRTIPAANHQYDVVMFVDVLHHVDDPAVLLGEGARVAARAVVIKDHFRDGVLAGQTLRFMDRVGNTRFGVALPGRYLSRAEWGQLWNDTGLYLEHIQTQLGLYPAPLSWLFERSLHFVARLRT